MKRLEQEEEEEEEEEVQAIWGLNSLVTSSRVQVWRLGSLARLRAYYLDQKTTRKNWRIVMKEQQATTWKEICRLKQPCQFTGMGGELEAR
jgi:hypothetical protein